MADFDLAIELGDVGDGFGKLESDLGGRNCASGLLVKRSVCQLGALLLRKLVDFGVVGDGGRGRLDFGLLLARLVSRRGKDGKVVDQILRLVLLNRSGKRAVRVEVKEGDAEGLLSAGLERVGEANPVVLGIAMRSFVLACKSQQGPEVEKSHPTCWGRIQPLRRQTGRRCRPCGPLPRSRRCGQPAKR